MTYVSGLARVSPAQNGNNYEEKFDPTSSEEYYTNHDFIEAWKGLWTALTWSYVNEKVHT